MNQFDQILKKSINSFRKNAIESIKEGPRDVQKSDGIEVVDVKRSKIQSGLSTICPTRNFDNYKENFFNHFSELNRYLTLCSSPQSFRSAWNLRSEKLSIFDAEKLINEGAQLSPVNKKSRVFDYERQGVLYGPNRRLILGVRHSEGNYKDALNEVGEFSYQPPVNCKGLLRYRWCHYLSEKLNIPYILLVIMWFEYRLNEELNQLFIIAPAKIINEKSELDNLNDNLENPLELQLINRKDALESLLVLDSRKDSLDDIDVRIPISDTLAREWSYTNINNSEKGKKIKRWARENGQRCPGTICNNKPFRDISLPKIAFGHIISQKWSKTFTYLLTSIHHPDNLYLTCSRCNSSLSDRFPGSELRAEIIDTGTIGDWIRKKENEIRKS